MKIITDFNVKYDTLELEWLISVDTLDTVRQFRTHAGDYEVNTYSDGRWTVIDTSYDLNNSYTIKPPKGFLGLLEPSEYAVDSYEESGTKSGTRGTASVTLKRYHDRDVSDDVWNESPNDDEWYFEFSRGSFATKHVHATDLESKNDAQFTVRLDFDQAQVPVWSATRLDTVSVEKVEDGDDFIRDNSPNNRNTVTITRPSDMQTHWLPNNGDYIVREWSVTYDAQLDVYDLTMTVRKK